MSIDSHLERCLLVQTSRAVQSWAVSMLTVKFDTFQKMGINGHTRLDLYSSCTAVQVTLKILHSYYSYFPYKNSNLVNILPRTVQLCGLDQKTPFKMGINGHTRLDLYSSCTAGQVTLKILHSYYRYSIDSHLKFFLTYFPGLYSSAKFGPKDTFQWESMDIPDLTCTVPVRPYRSL